MSELDGNVHVRDERHCGGAYLLTWLSMFACCLITFAINYIFNIMQKRFVFAASTFHHMSLGQDHQYPRSFTAARFQEGRLG